MRKTVFGCLGVAAVAFALHLTMAHAQAGLFDRFTGCTPCSEVGPCDDANSCDPCEAVCGTKAGKWFFKGHAEAGFFANAHGRKSRYNNLNIDSNPGQHALIPMTGNTELLGNVRQTGLQLNQLYFSMGRAVDGKRGWDFGGTFDVTFGTDARFVQANGLERAWKQDGTARVEDRIRGEWRSGDYYTAIAQAYLEAANGRTNVKAGKFHAPFGSNPYDSTERFFYSFDQAAIYLPHTASGIVASYQLNNRWSVFGGWIMPDEFFVRDDANYFLGGFTANWSKDLSFKYAFAMGRDNDKFNGRIVPADGTGSDMFVSSFGMEYKFNKRLKWVLDASLLKRTISVEPALVDAGTEFNDPVVSSITNEFIYQYNKKWAFGLRTGTFNFNRAAKELEAFLADDFFIDSVANGTEAGPTEWYTASIGANWTPNAWLTVKPEIRYDWMRHRDVRPFNLTEGGDRLSSEQFSGGVSAVVKF
jgi:hypothetical protein